MHARLHASPCLIGKKARSGAAVVETALILPVFMLLLIGFIVAGLGVFRFHEVAALAREASRYASVHGTQYQLKTGNLAATKDDVYKKAILPNVVGLDVNNLNYDVTWSPDKRRGSLVTVTISYRWLPEAFLGGMDLKSTSTATVSY